MLGNDDPTKPTDDETEKLSFTAEKESSFECILDRIGSRGKFQIRLSCIYICLSVLLCTSPSHMFIMSMVVPDHWCHVPGRELSNVSIEEWKSLTIPRKNGSYSKCSMYKNIEQGNETISCQYGWEFDTTWYSLTLPAQEKWVCDREIVVSNTLALIQGLSVVVGLAICYIGDRFGRRTQYFVSLSMISVCRSLSVLAVSIYPLFIVLSVLGTAADSSTTEATTAIGLELTDIMHRSTINFQFTVMYCVGSMVSPLIAWATRNWMIFMLASSVPCFLLFSCQSFLPESPRWLLNKGHTKRAYSVVHKIAQTNRRHVPADTLEILNAMSKRRSANMGVLSLVTNRNLFKNTLRLIFGRLVCILTRSTMMFNIGNLGGNPFLAYMVQGAFEFPGNLAAHFLGNRFGRRFTEAFSLLGATLVSVAIIIVMTVSGPDWMVNSGAVLLRFFSSMSLFTNIIQSMEIHPTCVRQIGSAIEWAVIAAMIGVAPYIVYLGELVDRRCLYGVLGILLFLAAVVTSFLPESLHERLPETLEDATNYGACQKYWSLPVIKKGWRSAIYMPGCVLDALGLSSGVRKVPTTRTYPTQKSYTS
ncbi:solute carrier family 22 member 7-like [Schistocerca gregaria]|uniref:solute carrier family 22 member 7-like n=1 Tax=Schistocerca gregaria TaxID=7010 RepID=UPI00211E18B9|nr:solute carrier family 22 member 7-like [Schistocerca gregaria]